MYMEAIEVCEHWETIQDNQPTQAGHQTYLIVCQYQASGLQDTIRSVCYEIQPTSNQECEKGIW
jgi:hypothetical protein